MGERPITMGVELYYWTVPVALTLLLVAAPYSSDDDLAGALFGGAIAWLVFVGPIASVLVDALVERVRASRAVSGVGQEENDGP